MEQRFDVAQQHKIIFSLRVMVALTQRGFTPLAQMPNPKDPKYVCWVYEVTPEFKSALDKVLGGIDNG